MGSVKLIVPVIFLILIPSTDTFWPFLIDLDEMVSKVVSRVLFSLEKTMEDIEKIEQSCFS